MGSFKCTWMKFLVSLKFGWVSLLRRRTRCNNTAVESSSIGDAFGCSLRFGWVGLQRSRARCSRWKWRWGWLPCTSLSSAAMHQCTSSSSTAMHQYYHATVHQFQQYCHCTKTAMRQPPFCCSTSATALILHIPCAFTSSTSTMHCTVLVLCFTRSTALYCYVLDCTTSPLLPQHFHWH